MRRRIKALGNVNTESLNDLDELESRYNDLAGQLSDLKEAKAALEDIIRRINAESRKMFLETFESICTNFRELFRKLFGGVRGTSSSRTPRMCWNAGSTSSPAHQARNCGASPC